MNNNEELRLLAKKHNLTHAKIAELLDMQKESVDKWFLTTKSYGYRNCPSSKLKLLKILLNEKKR